MPILFTVGKFQVFTYGVFLVLGFLIASFIVFRYGRWDLKEEEYMDAFVYTSFFFLIGARIFYILTHFESFSTNLLSYIVFRIEPGLSLYGGLFFGVLFLWYYAKKRKINLQRILDVFSIASSFGFSIVSLGSFMSGGSFGKVTKLPWGVRVEGATITTGLYHPVELYQALVFFLLFLVLSFLSFSYYRKKEGQVSIVYLTCLSFFVFLLEFLKAKPVYLYYHITLNHLLSLGIFVGCIVYIGYGFVRTVRGKNI